MWPCRDAFQTHRKQERTELFVSSNLLVKVHYRLATQPSTYKQFIHPEKAYVLALKEDKKYHE